MTGSLGAETQTHPAGATPGPESRDVGAGPTISAVIPTRDRPQFLTEALESVFAQTRPVIEAIVVDDCSSVDLSDTVAPFGERVRLIRLETQSGANVARNTGLHAARGELVAFLDDDDVWVPEKLERQVEALAAGAEACLTGAKNLGSDSFRPRPLAEVDGDSLRLESPCGTSALLARRDVLLEEPFDPALPRGQDWDVFVRLSQRRSLAYVQDALYLRRVGHDRITTAGLRQSPEELFEAAAALHKHRAWLGEAAYRRRLAGILLKYIGSRPNPTRFLLYSLRKAGLRGTLAHLTSKFQG